MTSNAYPSSNLNSHGPRRSMTSAILVAFGSAATLFGSLSAGLSFGTEVSTQNDVKAEARLESAPRTSVAVETADRAPHSIVAFVPQYSEAIRRQADAEDLGGGSAPSSPYPAHAGLSR